MGQKYSQANYADEKSKYSINIVSKNHFEFQYIIGRGGFGKVWRVKLKKYRQEFALKEMSKVKIIDKKSERSIMSEREILSHLNHSYEVI
jgi:protein kinase A